MAGLNVIELRELIEPFRLRLSRFGPQRIKAYLMLLMATIMMFFISWKLTLIFFGCFLAIGLERLCCFRIQSKRKKDCRNHIKHMNAIAEEQGQQDAYADRTKRFHQLNEQL